MGACVSACVVRDARHRYNVEELGKTEGYAGGTLVWKRDDFVLAEDVARPLHMSSYRHLTQERPRGVVVFLHGSCGDSRDHAAKAQHVVEKLHMDAVLVDFGGCGRSSGRVTCGIEEQQDFHRVMHFVRNTHPEEPVGICGFSLGAAVALMGAHHYPEIACMVLDSCFSRLPDAIKHWLRCRVPGPKAVHKPLARWVIRSVRDSCGLDLRQVAPINYVHLCNMPVLFLGVEGDTVVPPECADELFNRHQGYSELLRLSGTHNGQRTEEVVERQMGFLARHLAAARAAAGYGSQAVQAAAETDSKAECLRAAASRPAAAAAAAERADISGGCEFGLQRCHSYVTMRGRPVGVKGIRVSLDAPAKQQAQQQQQQWRCPWQFQQQEEELQAKPLLQHHHRQQQQQQEFKRLIQHHQQQEQQETNLFLHQQQQQEEELEAKPLLHHQEQQVEEDEVDSQSSLSSQGSSVAALCTVTLLLDGEQFKGSSSLQRSSLLLDLGQLKRSSTSLRSSTAGTAAASP